MQTYSWKIQINKRKSLKIIYYTTIQEKTINILVHSFIVLLMYILFFT